MADSDKIDHELLLAAVEGELTPAQQRQIDDLRRRDPRIGRLIEGMTHDRAAIRALPDPVAPHWIMDEVDRELEREMLVGVAPEQDRSEAIRQGFVIRRIAVFAAMAAMLAVVATVIIGSLMHGGSSPLEPGPLTVAAADDRGTPPDAGAEGESSDAPPVAVADGTAPATPQTPDAPPAPPDEAVARPVDLDAALKLYADAARDPLRIAQLNRRSEAGSLDDALEAAAIAARGATESDPPAVVDRHRPILSIDSKTHDHLLPAPPIVPGAAANADPEPQRKPIDASKLGREIELELTVADLDVAEIELDAMLIERFEGERLAVADAPRGVLRYRVPADRIPAIVAAVGEIAQHIDARSRGTVESTPAAPVPKTAWPAVEPDYLSILRQQLEAADRVRDTVELPVTLKRAR